MKKVITIEMAEFDSQGEAHEATVDFESPDGTHISKKELLMCRKALSHAHRRKVREYRKIMIQKAKVYDGQVKREQTRNESAGSVSGSGEVAGTAGESTVGLF